MLEKGLGFWIYDGVYYMDPGLNAMMFGKNSQGLTLVVSSIDETMEHEYLFLHDSIVHCAVMLLRQAV